MLYGHLEILFLTFWEQLTVKNKYASLLVVIQKQSCLVYGQQEKFEY